MDLCADCLLELPWLGLSEVSFRLPTSCIAALAYAPPADRLVTGLKFHRQRYCGRVLGEVLAIAVQEAGHAGLPLLQPDCLVPVPLHARRERERGYNQAELIARAMGAKLGIPVVTHWLERRRETGAQARLGRRSRLANPSGAFAVRGQVQEELQGLRIALVDDVVTTGATLNSCARALTDAGAGYCEGWVIARTLLRK